MKRTAQIFLVLLVIAMLVVLFVPQLGTDVDIASALQSPNLKSWLGRDSLGRDIFVRVLQGAQVSIALGLGSSLAALLIGVCFAAVAAMTQRWVDVVLMRLCDILMSLPSVMFMAILALIFQTLIPDQNLTALFAVLTLGSWMPFARYARNLILKEKSRDYVEAAHAIGAAPGRVFFRHIAPNLIPTLLIFWSLQVPHAILAEGLLSFLGFGVRSPGVSWGALLQDGWKTVSSYPHLLLGPALFLFLTVLSLNILLDHYRRSFDPQLKWDRSL